MPQTTLKNAVPMKTGSRRADGKFKWKDFDENTAAAMCYTSGHHRRIQRACCNSHRSNVLHGLMANNVDRVGTSAAEEMLPVVHCSMPTAGASPSPRPRWAPSW